MMSFIKKLIRFLTTKKYIVKKRYVFYTDIFALELPESYSEPDNFSDSFFDFKKKSKAQLKELLADIVPEYRLKRYVKRYDDPDMWEVIFAYINQKPVACYWYLKIPNSAFRFDSFIHEDNQILLGSAYVKGEMRGKGINKLLRSKVAKKIKECYPERLPLSIIEAKNHHSLKSVKVNGVKLFGTNYLIKFLGKNIFSLFKDMNGKWKVWFLPLYKQTHY